MKRTLICVALLMMVVQAEAVLPGTALYLPAVGKGQGGCIEGVCSQWSTAVWIYNPGDETARVTAIFLQRGLDNSEGAPRATIVVPPGTTFELADVMADPFALEGVFGAMRFVSATPIVVTGRIEDTNVETHRGQGTAGQFFGGMSILESIGFGESQNLVGLAEEATGEHRSNFGFVEITGLECEVTVDRLDGTGTVLASKVYDVPPFSQIQKGIADVGGAMGTNQMLRVTVTDGHGRILPFASFLDNITADPSSILGAPRVVDPSIFAGHWEGHALNLTDPDYHPVRDAILDVEYDPAQQLLTLVLEINGLIFGTPNPGPETFTATLSGDGFHFTGVSTIYGTYDFVIDLKGQISGTLSEFSQGYLIGITFNGTAGSNLIGIASKIEFIRDFFEDFHLVFERSPR